MKAIHISRYDGPGAIAVVDTAPPVLAGEQVLIDVAAAGVSFPEVLQTRGQYQFQPPLPFVPGAEVAGTVLEAPPSTGYRAGDRVCAYSGSGGFAEQVAVAAERVLPLPDNISFVDGAALPLNYLTAHFALTVRHRVARGSSVLVHGAAGGVGTAMIQTEKALGAGNVVGVVSTPEKAGVARKAGADSIVDATDFLEQTRSLHPDGVDLVVDPVGGERFTDSLRSLTPTGRLLVVGFAAGGIPTVKVNRLLLNNLDVIGVGWGAFALKRTGYLHQQWTEIEPHLVAGRLAPIIGATFALHEAESALTLVDERRASGKVVLTVT